MKMSKNTLLKKIEQGYRENYCNGEYTLNLVTENKEESTYVLNYTYETGEKIAITITASYLGQVSFYSNIHNHYISNFNIHTKSVINVMRTLFELIDCNKDDMLKWYTIEETNKIKGHIYVDTDSVKVAPLPEQQTWKRYSAIANPEWHHVSLATLANLDFDMIDEKRQRYLTVYKEMQETLTRLRKCKTLLSYDNCCMTFLRRKNVMWAEGKISNEMRRYIEAKLSMQNVESGSWSSAYEEATGYHESRRYNKSRID